MKWTVLKKKFYSSWYNDQSTKYQALIQSRLQKIEDEGHFGKIRWLDDGLWELKFNIGIRIYYARTGQFEITLFIGGTKHGQEKDIKKAKTLIYD